MAALRTAASLAKLSHFAVAKLAASPQLKPVLVKIRKETIMMIMYLLKNYITLYERRRKYIKL